MLATVIEAVRMVLIQILLRPSSVNASSTSRPSSPTARQGGMSPLKSLYFFAPAGLAVNSVFLLLLEGLPAIRAIPTVGISTLLLNASLTFALNLSAVSLIGISAMILTLSKILKDTLMVIMPVLTMGEKASRSASAICAPRS
jgi:hypothetical protein